MALETSDTTIIMIVITERTKETGHIITITIISRTISEEAEETLITTGVMTTTDLTTEVITTTGTEVVMVVTTMTIKTKIK